MVDENGQEQDGGGSSFYSWILGFCLLTIVIPILLIISLPADQRADGIATLATVPVIEYMAVAVGIGLGIAPITSFILTVSPCIGICMLVIGLLEALGKRSERAMRFRERVQKKVDNYPKVRKYGVVSSSLFVIITGVYIGSGISYLLGWPKTKAMVFMSLGIGLITLVIGLGTVGILNLFFL